MFVVGVVTHDQTSIFFMKINESLIFSIKLAKSAIFS